MVLNNKDVCSKMGIADDLFALPCASAATVASGGNKTPRRRKRGRKKTKIRKKKRGRKRKYKCYNIAMIVYRDEVRNVEQEVTELKRLLNEARIRRRYIYKRRKLQGWWDWIWEQLGY